MTVHSLLTTLPRPSTNGETVVTTVSLPPQAVPLLSWLADRWSMDIPSLAADVIVTVCSGRYALAQLVAHDMLPRQDSAIAGSPDLELALLPESAEALTQAAGAKETHLARTAGHLILRHLQGKVRPWPSTGEEAGPGGDLMKKDDASLTVWLPAELQTKIDDLAEHHELTRSDIIRNSLLLHTYGRVRYEAWTSEGNWRPKRKASSDLTEAYRMGSIRFSPDRPWNPSGQEEATDKEGPGDQESDDGIEVVVDHRQGRRTEFIRQHGKSEKPARVFLPELLKRRLEELGSLAGLPASEHCRRTLAAVI